MKFYIGHAFTDELFGGNPAGIVLLEENEEFPQDERMRKTAAELRYSETAFLKQIGQKTFQFRYFTPTAEVELCGHATIAAFRALLENGMVADGDLCEIHTLSALLSVHLQNGLIMMEMASPKLLCSIVTQESLQALYRVLGLSYVPVISPTGSVLLPMIISTGLPDIILPVQDAKSLADLSPDFPALAELSKNYGVIGVHAFTLDCADVVTANTLAVECSSAMVYGDAAINARCRNFAPLYGINEEAATGTANGALTDYLYRNGLISPGNTCCFLQGESMKRASKIYTLLETNLGTTQIKVGGTSVILASGIIHL